MKRTQYLNEDERKIFINYYIRKKSNCKVDYIDFLSNQAELYDSNIDTLEGKKNPFSLEFDFSEVYWDETKNDNIATYLFSQPKFEMTNTRLKDLKKLGVDLSFQNADGNTILHLLVQNKNLSLNGVRNLSQTYNIDTDLKNNEGKRFSNYLLDYLDMEFKARDYLMFQLKELGKIEQVKELLFTYEKHFADYSIQEIELAKDRMEQLKQRAIKHLLDVNDLKYPTLTHDPEKYVSLFLQPLNTLINKSYLEKVMTSSVVKPKRKKI